MDRKVSIQPDEHANRGIVRHARGAGPKPSLRVALAVVHPVSGYIGLDWHDHLEPSVTVNRRETIGHRGHVPARRAPHHGARILRDLDLPVHTRCRVELVNALAFDVDPDQEAGGGVPNWALTDDGVCVDDQLDRG